ncbi:hypothetical protein RCH21_002178 [Arthrobacter sp. PL16]|uniref:ABC transporter permease n=1 Tax=Arthrobacter cheniae TaxID=1258888 RepID=A0A3A5MD66_9MICC|nr:MULTISPECIES: hypothetical protein [Arthrobacter]MEC5199939.1 hypothetical protein [Arthrobacter sp. PL16]RJT79259.1 hypothetical protein D6T63_11695 [Arthrobacter cheniae]
MRASQEPDAGSSNYPPAVYAVAENRRSVPPAGVFWWLGSTILLGAVIGVAWWLLAPTGRVFGDPVSADQWVLRDLTLAGLELVAGVAVGTVVAVRLRGPGVVARILAAIGGSVLGSLLALGVGEGLAYLFGPHGRDELPGSDFLLQSYGALAIWPAVAAVIIFVTALIGLARRRS